MDEADHVATAIARDDQGRAVGLVSMGRNITIVNDLPKGISEERVQFIAGVSEEAIRLLIAKGAGGSDAIEIRQAWKPDFPIG